VAAANVVYTHAVTTAWATPSRRRGHPAVGASDCGLIRQAIEAHACAA